MNLELIKKYFEPKSILDVGGHIGDFYSLCKDSFDFEYYFIVEANENCITDLQKLNVPMYIGLVGKENGFVNFYKTKEDPKSTGNSIYRENSRHFNDDNIIIEQKKITTLDSLRLCNLDLIKIDTQGSELDILEGAKKTLENNKGIILEVSVTDYNQNAPLEEEVIAYMDKINYHPAELLNIHKFQDGTIFQKDIFFIKK